MKEEQDIGKSIRKPLSESTKQKISIANKGKKRSEEFKEKMRNHGLGRKPSQETVKKRVLKLKGRKMTEAQVEKMKEAAQGRKFTREAILKGARASKEANTGRVRDWKEIEPIAGEKNINAKLTQEKVLEMRNLYASGFHSYKSIAKLFNMSVSQTHRVINNQSWKHIESE